MTNFSNDQFDGECPMSNDAMTKEVPMTNAQAPSVHQILSAAVPGAAKDLGMGVVRLLQFEILRCA